MRLPLLERLIPSLAGADYEKTSEPTPQYNCVAHAAEDDQHWWWPFGVAGFAWWPQGVPRTHAEDIDHHRLEDVGGAYGSVVRVLRRPGRERSPAEVQELLRDMELRGDASD